jgi:hypothetical protein
MLSDANLVAIKERIFQRDVARAKGDVWMANGLANGLIALDMPALLTGIDRLHAAEAELAALKARRCDECVHHGIIWDDGICECQKWQTGVPITHYCAAHEPREEASGA